MRNLPFDKPGRFYRGNLHAHSTRSDGLLAPEEVVAAYRERGYDFVAVTDHFMERFRFPVTDTRPMRTDGFTTLLGAELHGQGLRNGGLWHIVAVGLPVDFGPQTRDENGPEMAARAHAIGAFVSIAHPARNGVTMHDVNTIADFDAIEVHNEGHTNDSDRGNGWMLADALATSGKRFSTIAADDAHFKDRPDRFGGWVQVRSETLEPAALLDALKQGWFYASTGPEIDDVAFVGEEIVVSCASAVAIMLGGRGSICRFARGDGLTRAAFPLAGAFCRVTVIDERGKKAWTNPLWLDELTIG
ncbi:MAG: CehA/McbA family metallohydrolase [Chloroflexia bacterium]|nr:CehA/McbA family metallohydrolase [Chloroflexia bacterium]